MMDREHSARKNKINRTGTIFSIAIMLLALLWLTVSTPFVYAAQQASQEAAACQEENDSLNPFTNTTEEKTESGTNTLSEYLHDACLQVQYTIPPSTYTYERPFMAYSIFHGELISPPPEG
jgi:hypothetical protein